MIRMDVTPRHETRGEAVRAAAGTTNTVGGSHPFTSAHDVTEGHPPNSSTPGGSKGRFRIALSVLSCRSGFCCRRSTGVSSKMAGTTRDAPRRRRTELLGQLLGGKWDMVAVIPITRPHV